MTCYCVIELYSSSLVLNRHAPFSCMNSDAPASFHCRGTVQAGDLSVRIFAVLGTGGGGRRGEDGQLYTLTN